jgi:hypothetical protein
MPFSEVGVLLQGQPDLASIPMAAYIGEALRTGVASPDPEIRFLAQFIAERSRRRRPDTDGLDPLQISLIFRRLASELLVSHRPPPDVGRRAVSPLLQLSQFNASGSGGSFPPGVPTPPPGPCHLNSSNSAVVYYAEKAIKDIWFKNILDYLARRGVSQAVLYKQILDIAKHAIDLAKLIAIMTTLKVEVSEQGLPIERTEFMVPARGTRARFTATLFYDISDFQAVNCLRLAFANVGINFNVPQRGPVVGSGATLLGLHGFGLPSGSEKFVQWGSGRPDRQTTDVSGQLQYVVDGAPQTRAIPQGAQRDVRKQATVQLQLVVKQADIFRDLVEAFQAQSGGVANPLKIVIELILRTRWAFNYEHSFTVMDFGNPGYRFPRMNVTHIYRSTDGSIVESAFTASGYVCTHESRRYVLADATYITKLSIGIATIPAPVAFSIDSPGPHVPYQFELLEGEQPQLRMSFNPEMPGLQIISRGPPSLTSLSPSPECEAVLPRFGLVPGNS